MGLESAVGADPAAEAPASPVQPVQPVELIDQKILLAYLAGRANFTLIDARSPAEYAGGHIERALNVPHDAIEGHAQRLPADPAAPLVVYCKTGQRAAALREALLARGFEDVRVLPPAQIFWMPDASPVFNCGVPMPSITAAPPGGPGLPPGGSSAAPGTAPGTNLP